MFASCAAEMHPQKGHNRSSRDDPVGSVPAADFCLGGGGGGGGGGCEGHKPSAVAEQAEEIAACMIWGSSQCWGALFCQIGRSHGTVREFLLRQKWNREIPMIGSKKRKSRTHGSPQPNYILRAVNLNSENTACCPRVYRDIPGVTGIGAGLVSQRMRGRTSGCFFAHFIAEFFEKIQKIGLHYAE